MSYQFHRWLITLNAQLQSLRVQATRYEPESLRHAMKQAEAELQCLYAYAEQHTIDLGEYHQPLAEIEAHLLILHQYATSLQPDHDQTI